MLKSEILPGFSLDQDSPPRARVGVAGLWLSPTSVATRCVPSATRLAFVPSREMQTRVHCIGEKRSGVVVAKDESPRETLNSVFSDPALILASIQLRPASIWITKRNAEVRPDVQDST